MSTFYAQYPVEGGVTSLNGLTGALTLVGAGGITITPSGTTITLTGSGGTVTSVGLADATGLFTISGSPVTTSGTLTLASLNSQSANTFFAAPNGSSGSPTFRAIVAADLPNLSGTYVTQAEVGAANGVAPLGASGKIAVGYLPADVFVYQGTWNPTTNTPTLQDSTGTTAGYVYWVSAAYAGPISGLSNPSMVNFQIGDLVLFNGTQYELTTPAAGVQSVNGAQGVVTVNAINQLTGDGAAGPVSGSASAAFTLATVNSNVGSFTNANITVNAKGLITAASNGSGGGANTALSNLTTTSINQSLIPNSASAYNLGSSSEIWGTTYSSSVSNPTGTLTLVGGGNISLEPNGASGGAVGIASASSLQFYDTANDNAVGFQAPSTLSATTVWTLPSADGTSNQVLTTNGSKVLSWSTVGSGSVTAISVVSANGLAGTSSGGATPALTLSTTVTGILQGNGTSISAATTTGSGSVVLSTSPTLVTPNLGTPSSLTLTNATGTPTSIGLANGTGLPLSTGVAGTLALGQGGTNAAITAVAGGIVYSTASAMAISAAGASGQILTSGGTGTPAWETTVPATNLGGQGTVHTSSFTTASSSSTSTIYHFKMVGGGGGGGGTNGSQSGGGGGGAGGYAEGTFSGIAPSTFITVTINGGGVGGGPSGTTGAAGGSASIAATGLTTLTVTGGNGGTGTTGSVGVVGGTGGSLTSGTAQLFQTGGTGGGSWPYTGGGTIRGGWGAGSAFGTGGDGGDANVSGGGQGATQYGAGGGGAIGASATGGDGAAGFVIITQLTP